MRGLDNVTLHNYLFHCIPQQLKVPATNFDDIRKFVHLCQKCKTQKYFRVLTPSLIMEFSISLCKHYFIGQTQTCACGGEK